MKKKLSVRRSRIIASIFTFLLIAFAVGSELTLRFYTPSNQVASTCPPTTPLKQVKNPYPSIPVDQNTNYITNSSVEITSDTNQPVSWSKNSWGTNDATFSYLDTGHISHHSLEILITTYASGDAKWIFSPLVLTPGLYQYTDYYQSDVQTRVVTAFTLSDGSVLYNDLKRAFPTSSWTKYTDSLEVPSGATGVSVFHLIDSKGYLIADDFSLMDYQPVGFKKPLVTLTFDNGFEDNITTVLPYLVSFGFKSTQEISPAYLVTDQKKNPKGPDYVRTFYNAGSEIASHTWDHSDLTRMSKEQIDEELSSSQKYLEKIVGQGNVKNFALPFGAYNSQVLSEVSKYYRSDRTTDPGYNSKDNFDINTLKVQNMLNTTSLGQFQGWLDRTKATNTWLVLVYHRVGKNPRIYDTPVEDFCPQLEAINNSGITVVTLDQALDEILPQLKK